MTKKAQAVKGAPGASSLADELVTALGFDDAQRAAFREKVNEWERALRPFEEELKKSEAVTEEDLAVRINVRDSE